MRQDDGIARPLDQLSSPARQILTLNAKDAYSKLVPDEPGNAAAEQMLAGVEPQKMLAKAVTDLNEARGLIAGLYLWHDHLEKSHTIAQSIPTPTGSFWHAIMHRREGDFSNSKYWYARCANHPALTFIAARVDQAIAALPADKQLLRLTHGGWNPNAFVDLVENLHHNGADPLTSLAIEIQRIEWRCLFDHGIRQACE